jgi:protease-4
VVVSMAGLAASGGYYISASANKIVAEPGTLTGSIGVLTGKVSVGKSLDLVGVGFDQVSVGKNTLMDSPLTPFTDDQWAALNHQADVIYDDFLHKVAAGRKLPVEQIKAVAGGRVWSGADAKTHGLVDQLGGFWTASALAAQLGGVPQDQVAYKIYPRRHGLLEGLVNLMGGAGVSMRALGGVETLMELPAVQSLLGAVHDAPRGGVEMRAVGLTQDK